VSEPFAGWLLAIESSCDETAAAVLAPDGSVVANVIHSQVAAHAPYGGVVPEIASREHLLKVAELVDRALAEAGIGPRDVDAVAATYGPGLIGALLVGLQFAKGFAQAHGHTFLGVHHIEGHLMASSLDAAAPEPPFIGLVASGGHSAIYRYEGPGRAELLGETRDDAAGEAFDKTAVRLLVEKLRVEHGEVEGQMLRDVCAALRRAIVDALLNKAFLACRRTQILTLVLGGGVAANSLLRREAERRGAENDVRVYVPPRELCTDNAAMIAACARAHLRKGERSALTLRADPGARVGAPPA